MKPRTRTVSALPVLLAAFAPSVAQFQAPTGLMPSQSSYWCPITSFSGFSPSNYSAILQAGAPLSHAATHALTAAGHSAFAAQSAISFERGGRVHASSSCFVTALLHAVAPAHAAAVPPDLRIVGLPLPRGDSYATYFQALAAGGAAGQSALWSAVSNIAMLQAGDVLAWSIPSPVSDDTGAVAVVVGPAQPLAAQAQYSPTGALLGMYMRYAVPVIDVAPQPHFNDTRRPSMAMSTGMGMGGNESAGGGIGRGSVIIMTDMASAPAGIQVAPRAPVVWTTVAAGRMVTSGVPGVAPALHSVAMCDGLGQQSPMLVATMVPPDGTPAAIASPYTQLYVFRGDTGFPAREFSLPLPAAGTPLGVACGDVMPGGTAEALLFPSAPNAPPGTLPSFSGTGSLTLVSLAAGASLWTAPLPFTGPASACIGDVNGDGFNDVVAASTTAGDTFYVWLFEPADVSNPGAGGSLPTAPSATIATTTGSDAGLSVSCAPLLDISFAPSMAAIVVAPATASPGGPLPAVPVEVWAFDAITRSAPSSPTLQFALPAADFSNGVRVAAVGASFVRGWILAASVPEVSVAGSVLAGSSFALLDTADPAAPPMPVTVPVALSGAGGIPILINGGAIYPPPAPGSTIAHGGAQPVFILGSSGDSGSGNVPLYFKGVSANMASSMSMSSAFMPFTPVFAPTAARLLEGGLPAAGTWPPLAANTPALQPAASGSGVVYQTAAATWRTVWSGTAPSTTAAVRGATMPRPLSSIALQRNHYASPVQLAFSVPLSARTTPALGSVATPASSWSETPSASWYTPALFNSSATGARGPVVRAFAAPALAAPSSGAIYARERLLTSALAATGLPLDRVISYGAHRMPGWSPDNRAGWALRYSSDARHTNSIDSPDFAAWVWNSAFGLQLPTHLASQAAATVANITGSAIPVHGAVVAQAPLSYAALVAALKPGDVLYVDGGAQAGQGAGTPSPSRHALLWLGYVATDPALAGVPMIVDSSDNAPPHVDSTGTVIPPGPNIRPFVQGGWYHAYFSHATRWIFDAEDSKMLFPAMAGSGSGSGSPVIDPLTGFARSRPAALPVNAAPAMLPARVGGALAASMPTLPLVYDPRPSFCYSGPVLNQGMCGSCYANSGAEVISIQLCLAMQATFGAQQFVQVSPQYTMSIASSTIAASTGGRVSEPCAGGSPLYSVLQPFANWATTNADRNNATIPLLSCDITPTPVTGSSAQNIGANYGATIGVPCLAGCAPYQELQCGSTSGEATAAWMAANPQLCPPTYSTTACSSGAAYDLDTTAGSNALAYFNAAANYIGVSQGALAWGSNVQWAPSDIALVQSYLSNNGPVSVVMSACGSFQSWFQGCSGTGLYDSYNNVCEANSAQPGYAYSFAQGAYTAPYNETMITQPFGGASCPSGTSGHAVTIVGYTVINGVSSWIVRNSWGVSWGDGGHFYLATATAGCSSCATGSVSLSLPAFLTFSPRATPTNPLPGSSLGAAFINPSPAPGSSGGGGGGDNAAIVGGFAPVTNAATLTTVGNEFISALVSAKGSPSYTLQSIGAVAEQVVQAGFIYQITGAQVWNTQSKAVESHKATLFVPYGNAGAGAPLLSTDSFILQGSTVPNGTIIGSLGGGSTPAPGGFFADPVHRDAAIGCGVLLAIVVIVLFSYCYWRSRRSKLERENASQQMRKLQSVIAMTPYSGAATAGSASSPGGSGYGGGYGNGNGGAAGYAGFGNTYGSGGAQAAARQAQARGRGGGGGGDYDDAGAAGVAVDDRDDTPSETNYGVSNPAASFFVAAPQAVRPRESQVQSTAATAAQPSRNPYRQYAAAGRGAVAGRGAARVASSAIADDDDDDDDLGSAVTGTASAARRFAEPGVVRGGPPARTGFQSPGLPQPRPPQGGRRGSIATVGSSASRAGPRQGQGQFGAATGARGRSASPSRRGSLTAAPAGAMEEI